MCCNNIVLRVLCIVGGIVGGIALLIFIILISISFKVVDVGKWAIQVNWFENYVNPTPKDEGRYYTGLTDGFVFFPKTLQTMEFSTNRGNEVSARTKDGLKLYLDVTLQYQLQFQNLYTLYRTFLNQYSSILESIAREVIRDVASKWTALEFFNNRSMIADNMNLALKDSMSNIYATCQYLQLLKVDLPNKFESAIEQTEVARQQQEIASHEQNTARVRADTTLMYARMNMTVRLLQANATAQSLLLTKRALAQTTNITATARTSANQAIAQQLLFTPDELLNYLYIEALYQHDNDKVIFGVDKLPTASSS